MKQTVKKYVADFETTVPDVEKEENPETRVWAWGVSEIGADRFDYGTSIDEFMDWCYYRRSNPIIYFHNLRFDGEFILHWLFANGFTYSDEKAPKTFSTLITKMGQFYSIEITWEKKQVVQKNRKRTYYKKTVFYDSLKKLPFPVSTIAKAFKLPMKKLEIDYKQERAPGHILTKEEKEYLRNDVEIVAAALDVQFQQDLTKMTVASDAMAHFKNGLQGQFENSFPVLPLNVDGQIRYAYRGGFTYVSPTYAGVDVGPGVVLDKNSMYPWVMYEKPLPHGTPIWFDGKYEHDESYPLYIQEIYCEFQLKPDKIPTVQVKTGRYQENVYLENNIDKDGNDAPVTLFLTNMDLELFFDHYAVTVHYWGGGYKFRECTGIFCDYIDYWMQVKEENAAEKNALYTLAKLMLNSLYGKFASNPDVTGKYPYLKDDGSVGYRMKDEEYKDSVYTAMGVFITSWARYEIITSAQSVFPRFIYADTDSLHLEGTEIPDNLFIHPSKLGAWKHEGTFLRGRFLRQKTYIEDMPDGLHVTCAGMPNDIKEKVTWENFHEGFSEGGKLIPKHIRGGVVLVSQEFSIKPQTKPFTESDLKKWMKQMTADFDELMDGVREHGFIETVKKGDVYYSEYKEIPITKKRKYFRKQGVPIDAFATLLDLDVNRLIEKLRWGE
jgi:hypothetical protein